ncbi:MAG: UDP-N-acetylmuramoyl-tripeptide--D-alanyl-D-alanine ligase [bacterium]|nr:UDP-N-acetylmuramoyl-tripeptide--D-alanyl-D-alanine ligase [bacterium]
MTYVAAFSYHDLLAIFGDASPHLNSDIVVRGVSTDSRTLVAGNAFVALRGERFDGHTHIEGALEKGAACCIVDRIYFDNAELLLRASLIPVANTLHALGSLAHYHRKRFHIPIVAIAGSAGKTSTKELTAAVVSAKYRTLKTEANYNNQVGTPLTLLQLSSEHEVAIIEIGTNEPGEIELLCAMVHPTHGLITNIGKEHLEKLVDLDGVEREECTLFEYLADHDGLAFVNVDDERLKQYGYHQGLRRVVTFGIDHHADLRVHVAFDEDLHPIIHVVNNTFTFRAVMRLHGIAAALNAACAVAVAWALNVPADVVQHALSSYTSNTSHGYARMVVQHHNGLSILNDCYNANPESMSVAIETLRRYPAQRRIAVLGDMLELGTNAHFEHMAILEEAAAKSDVVITMGEHFREAVETMEFSNVQWCKTYVGCVEVMRDIIGANTAVLVKGSRGLAMERVIHLLTLDT